MLRIASGFFFVDKRFEISNQDFINDIQSIIKLEEVLSLLKFSVPDHKELYINIIKEKQT